MQKIMQDDRTLRGRSELGPSLFPETDSMADFLEAERMRANRGKAVLRAPPSFSFWIRSFTASHLMGSRYGIQPIKIKHLPFRGGG